MLYPVGTAFPARVVLLKCIRLYWVAADGCCNAELNHLSLEKNAGESRLHVENLLQEKSSRVVIQFTAEALSTGKVLRNFVSFTNILGVSD